MNKLKYALLIILSCLPSLFYGQSDQLVVTGKVYAESEGEIVGAQIAEIDKNKRIVSAAVTDFSGNFSLQIKNPENSIRFSYVGYKTVMLPIGSKRKYDVQLIDNTQLTEVVVKARTMHNDGTFAVPKREISGAIQKINTDEFKGLSVSSIDDALQGRIAGLDIVNSSGDLGSGSVLRIRGTTSINSNSQPLIVVNDVPFESNVGSSFDYSTASQEQFAALLNINPDDIEDIVVLKDGASAAIWGSKGANGVICIRTKKGIKGPTRVQFSYRFSGAQQPQSLKMLNGDDYTMLMKQAYFNPNQDENAANIAEFNYDPTFSEYENFNNNTDWVKEVTQYGFTNDTYLTVSGGGDRARFRASVGYYNQTGTVIEQALDRISSRMNLEYQVSDRIKFISDFSITYTNNNKSYEFDLFDPSRNFENILDIAYKKMPNVSIYQQDASGNNSNVFYNIPQSSQLNSAQKDLMNPVALAKLATNNEKSIRILPTLRLQYDILDPNVTRLRYGGYVSFDVDNAKYTRFLPKELTSRNWTDPVVNRAYKKEEEGLTIYTDQNLTWVPSLGDKHSLMLYGSWQLNSGNSRYEEFEKYGLPSQKITDPTTPGGYDRIFKSGSGEWRSMAIMGRLHYTFLERYILDMTFRRDGSTRFGYNNRWGNFPAISAKWIISDEKYMKFSEKWLSELAIRAGWGVTGNQPDKEYLYFSRYNGDWTGGNNYIDITTMKPVSIKLANLRWEKVTSYNLGSDLSFLDYRFLLDLNLYYRKTEDLLFKDRKIPSSTGFSDVPYTNAGTMENKGWEINFSTNKMIKVNNWTFDVSLNLANNINTIVSLLPSVLSTYNGDFDYKNGSYLSRVQEGNSFGSIYGFRFKGVYQYDQYQEGRSGTSPVATDADGNVIKDNNGNPKAMYFAYDKVNYKFRGGDAIYEDINHDGTIDELDIVYLGNSNPKINGGFGTTIRYKNFSMNAFFNFRAGNKIVNYARMYAESMYSNDNQSVAVNWRWRKDGDETSMPRALYQSGYNYLGSDRFVEDGSFLRFKYLTFGYSFEPAKLKSIQLNQLDLYLTLNNLVTFTKYTGVDPEVSIEPKTGLSEDKSKTPRSQYFTLGVTVGF